MSIIDDDSVEEVLGAERRWVQAHRDLDLEALENMLDEDYIQIRPDGKHFDYTARFMAIYTNRRGKWLLVADQSTPL